MSGDFYQVPMSGVMQVTLVPVVPCGGQFQHFSGQYNTSVTSQCAANGTATTICFRNVPNDYSHKEVVELLQQVLPPDSYDFVYVPHDWNRLPRLVNTGFFFVNFVDHNTALHAWMLLDNFQGWNVRSWKVLKATWANVQGLAGNIRRYQNSPVMKWRVPVECKPLVRDQDNMLQPLQPPTTTQSSHPLAHVATEISTSAGDDDSHMSRISESDDEGIGSTRFPSTCSEEAVPTVPSNFSEEPLNSKSPEWVPDSDANICNECEAPFNFIRRRHHCRSCGQVCCAQCAPQTKGNDKKYKRMCKGCKCLMSKGLSVASQDSELWMPNSPAVEALMVKHGFNDAKDEVSTGQGNKDSPQQSKLEYRVKKTFIEVVDHSQACENQSTSFPL
jgi:hypothetical protein